jgi:hypothetical protein
MIVLSLEPEDSKPQANELDSAVVGKASHRLLVCVTRHSAFATQQSRKKEEQAAKTTKEMRGQIEIADDTPRTERSRVTQLGPPKTTIIILVWIYKR